MKQKLIKLSLLLAICFVSTSSYANQELYLIIGQSNASGRDTNFDYSGEDSSDSEVRLFTDSGRFETAEQPLNKYSSIGKSLSFQGVNLGLKFGKKMHYYTGNTINLVVNARGGTRIAKWKKGHSSAYYEASVDRVKSAEQ